tara:strand:- start:2303 stop:3349 length:1047 start_codon:yes stop_codon:yes gene_type:complete
MSDFDSSDFNSRRQTEELDTDTFVDLTDAYAKSGMRIGFQHEPTKKQVYFKAFIKAFNETYSCDWNSESVFGRLDPIHTFKQTTRNITLSFVVPASTVSEGYDNLNRVQLLRSFLYPTYIGHNNALTINQNPLVRMSVMNMLVSVADNGGYGKKSYSDMFARSSTSPAIIDANVGGLGVISNLSIAYNLENPDTGVFQNKGGGYVLPKLIEISLDFKVIHENNIAWVDGHTENIYGLEGATTSPAVGGNLNASEGAEEALTGTGASIAAAAGRFATGESSDPEVRDADSGSWFNAVFDRDEEEGELGLTEGATIEEGSASTIESNEDTATAEQAERDMALALIGIGIP